jgi:hypothetical protein
MGPYGKIIFKNSFIGRGYTAGTLITQPIPPHLCLYSYISNFGDINKYT